MKRKGILSKISEELLAEERMTDEKYYAYSKRICSFTYSLLRFNVEREDLCSECACRLMTIKLKNQIDFENKGWVKYLIDSARTSLLDSFRKYMHYTKSKYLSRY